MPETGRNGQTDQRTKMDRNGQKQIKQTETDRNGQKRTETDRNRQNRTETNRNGYWTVTIKEQQQIQHV